MTDCQEIDPRKDPLQYPTITMLTEKLAKRDAENEKLNELLVNATARELMLRKDMDALKAHVERLRGLFMELNTHMLLSHLPHAISVYRDKSSDEWTEAAMPLSNTLFETRCSCPDCTFPDCTCWEKNGLKAHDAAIEKRVWNEAADLCEKIIERNEGHPIGQFGAISARDALRQKAKENEDG